MHYGTKPGRFERANHTLSHGVSERMSERTGEWPSTYIRILGGSGPFEYEWLLARFKEMIELFG